MFWRILLLAFCILSNVVGLPFESKGECKYKQEHCIQMTLEKHEEIQTIVEKITVFLNELAEEHGDYDIRLVKFDIESHSDDEVDEKDTVLQVTINDCATIAKETAEEDQKEHEYKKEVKTELEEEERNVKTVEETQRQEINGQDEQNKNDAQDNTIHETDNQEDIQDNKQDSENEEPDQTEIEKDNKISTTNEITNQKKSNFNTDATSIDQISSKTIDARDEQEGIPIQDTIEEEKVPQSKPTLVYLNLSENGQEVMKVLGKKRGKRPILVVLDHVNDQRRLLFPNRK